MAIRSAEFAAFMNTRRSVRFFSSDPVPYDVLCNVIKTAGLWLLQLSYNPSCLSLPGLRHNTRPPNYPTQFTQRDPQREPMEYGLHWVRKGRVRIDDVGFMLFLSISFALGTQHKPSFRWNMGLKHRSQELDWRYFWQLTDNRCINNKKQTSFELHTSTSHGICLLYVKYIVCILGISLFP